MLTAKEKIVAYRKALEYYRIGGSAACICSLLCDSINMIAWPDSIMFPEFFAQRPDGVGDLAAWWPRDESGRIIRIDVLEKAIANVKPD